MEKSIESIWKEGFVKDNALIAPQVNNLYKKKSIHIVDKFQYMFKINLIAIVVFSTLFLIVSFFSGIPIMGVGFFIIMNFIALVNKNLANDLTKLDKGENSFEFISAFNNWFKKQISINRKISKYIYPLFFFSMVGGFWFKDSEGLPLGERAVIKLLTEFPDMQLVFGVPLVGIIALIAISVILFLVGGKIYMWDFNIVYGRVAKKLEELLADIEEIKGNKSN